jgi:hypothetical protein
LFDDEHLQGVVALARVGVPDVSITKPHAGAALEVRESTLASDLCPDGARCRSVHKTEKKEYDCNGAENVPSHEPSFQELNAA